MLGNKYFAGIVGILLVLVIGYNAQFFMSRKISSSAPKDAEHAFKAQKAQKRSTPSRLPERPLPIPSSADLPAKADKGTWKRDPFSLQAGTGRKTAEMADDIRLMGIIKRDGKSHALINGKVYKVNDRIGTSVIREIRQHSIVILTEGKKQEITFDDYKEIKEKKK